MVIFKGAEYSDVFAELVVEYNAQERRLESYHVDYVWGMLEEVIRNYGHEVRNTRGKVAINYGIGQPIATPTYCSNFFKFLLHEKLQALRDGKWTQPPHTYHRCRVLSLVRNKPECGSSVARKSARSVPAPASSVTSPPAKVTSLPSSVVPRSTNPAPAKGQEKRSFNHQHGICVWHLAGSLGLLSKTTGAPYKCMDPSQPVHKPLGEVKNADALRAVADSEFMRTCGSNKVRKLIREAVKDKASHFA